MDTKDLTISDLPLKKPWEAEDPKQLELPLKFPDKALKKESEIEDFPHYDGT